jgi:tetratricopeptide (TPR) repeat protein
VTADGVKALGVTEFRDVMGDAKSIGVAPLGQPEGSLRKHYLTRRDELQAKARAGGLTTEEKVNLSEYLIRLRQFEEAVELLTPVAAQERQNFMVFANLATAHQGAGRLDRARSYLEQVKDYWPREWPGWSQQQLDWYRQAEKYHLLLVRLRDRELAMQRPGQPKAAEGLDPLFTDGKGPVRFVGESGQYEAGKLAAAEQAKLPKDARAVVQQLLLWVPGGAPGAEDTRLYWQLGELYNAAGDISAAAQVFDQCVWNQRFDASDLRSHRKVVQAALPESEPLVLQGATADVPTAAPAPAEGPTWLPNTRTLVGVGSVAAVVVVALVYLQIREFRRRRKSS